MSVAVVLPLVAVAPTWAQDDGADYVVVLRLVTWRPVQAERPGAPGEPVFADEVRHLWGRPSFMEGTFYQGTEGPSGFLRYEPLEDLDGSGSDAEVERQLAALDPAFRFHAVASSRARTERGGVVELVASPGPLRDLIGAPMSLKLELTLELGEQEYDGGYVLVLRQETRRETNLFSSRGAVAQPCEYGIGGTYRNLTHGPVLESDPRLLEGGWAVAEGDEWPITNMLPGHFMLLTVLEAPEPEEGL